MKNTDLVSYKFPFYIFYSISELIPWNQIKKLWVSLTAQYYTSGVTKHAWTYAIIYSYKI
jgi:hypothetical protein